MGNQKNSVPPARLITRQFLGKLEVRQILPPSYRFPLRAGGTQQRFPLRSRGNLTEGVIDMDFVANICTRRYWITTRVYFTLTVGAHEIHHPRIVLISMRPMHFRLTLKHFFAGYIARPSPFAFFFQESMLS